MNSENKSKIDISWFVVLLGLVAGIVAQSYSAYRHYELIFGFPQKDALCMISETFDCNAVALSEYSDFFGVPLAAWGLATNLFFLALWILSPRPNEILKWLHVKLGLLLVGASVVMGSISFFLIQKHCLFCMISYAASFLVWLGLTRFYGGSVALFKGVSKSFRTGIYVIVIPFLSLLIDKAAVAYFDLGKINIIITAILKDWDSNLPHKFTTAPAITKNPDGKTMHIVEFADFRCGHCKDAAESLAPFLKSHPDVRLDFVAFPLDGECNPQIQNKNGISCLLTKAAYCANQLGQGLAAHDWIFSHQTQFFGSLEQARLQLGEMSTSLGLNKETLLSCAQGQEFDLNIALSTKEAVDAGVKGTPTIFVNGKMLPQGQRTAVLKALYRKLKSQR